MIYKQFVCIIFIIFIFGAIAWCYLRNRIYEVEAMAERKYKEEVIWPMDSNVQQLWEEINKIKKKTVDGDEGVFDSQRFLITKDGQVKIIPFRVSIEAASEHDLVYISAMELIEHILIGGFSICVTPERKLKLKLKEKLKLEVQK